METGEKKEIYQSFAKINLSLEIIRRRPEGFHEISTVLQTINLYDTLTVSPSPDLQFDSNIPELVDENNLVWQAALNLHQLCPEGNKQGADLFLEKQIPVAAGLGGGSSNAATTLLALNNLWGLNLSPEKLEAEAAKLGSDVPFFLKGGTALAEGRGDRITLLTPLPPSWVILLYPPLEMPPRKTAELYKMLDRNDFTTGAITRTLVKTIQQGNRPPFSLFYNGFEKVVYERFTALDRFRQSFVDAGAFHVWISGSGPTLFTLLETEAEARPIFENLQNSGFNVYLAPTV